MRGAHGPIATPERDRDLAVGQIGEQEVEEIALSGGEAVLASRAQLIISFRSQQMFLGRRVGIFRVGHTFQGVGAPAAAAVDVGNGKTRDAEEPAGEACLVATTGDTAKGAIEDLLRHLLGLVLAVKPARRVVVDALDVEPIQFGKGINITLLGTGDQVADEPR